MRKTVDKVQGCEYNSYRRRKSGDKENMRMWRNWQTR